MYKLVVSRRREIKLLLLFGASIILFFLSVVNFPMFHTFVEIISITLGLSLMLISLGTMKICNNNYFQFLAIVFGLVGVVDLFHVLAYQGIELFGNDTNIPIQLWILARIYEFVMLSISSIYVKKKFNWYKIFAINSMIIILFILSILVFRIFPDCCINGRLTNFKKFCEYVTAFGFFILLIKVKISEMTIFKDNKDVLCKSIICKIISGIFFTIHWDAFGHLNMWGHFFKALSYYYGFKVIFRYTVVNPYTVLFEQLNNKIIELEKTNNELIKAKDKVQSTEKLYNKFVNFIPDGVLVIRNKKIEFANNTFLNMLQVDDKDKLVNMSIFDVVDDSFHDILKSRINVLREKVLEVPQQYIFMWKDKKKWVEVSSLIVNDEGGEYMISTLRSIEDKKKAEEAEQLLELKGKEEKMKNDFFTNISHELRTPINVIYSALQVENDYLKNDTKAEVIIKYNRIIRQNCLRLMRLINNLIDITRIETSFFEPNFQSGNIITIVEDITMSIVQYIESKNISLIFDTEIEESYVKFDPDLIERIVLNLLSNAVKYGREGGNIEVYMYENSAKSIAISIKDDGIGIPDEKKERIFDRFLKVDASLSRKTEGSGIGLALVKQLVEIHQGTIVFNSKLNQGTEFIITLPTIEYSSEVCATIEKQSNYEQNIIESAEIEFSDIYY